MEKETPKKELDLYVFYEVTFDNFRIYTFTAIYLILVKYIFFVCTFGINTEKSGGSIEISK